MTDKINNLVQQLEQYSEAYYKGNTLITDEVFDALEEELRKLDPTNNYFNKNRETSNGYGTKYPHIYEFIGSIDKIHSVEQSKLFNKPTSLSAKLDGTSLVVYYENGKLKHALTRGDGTTGFDVTQHFNAISKKYKINIPTDFTGAIRGEVVFTFENWEKFKQLYPEAKMPRNSGTGLINQKTAQPEAELLDYITYDVIASSINYDNPIKLLTILGFPTAPYVPLNTGEFNEQLLQTLFDAWSEIYPLDGIVIRNDEIVYNPDTQLYMANKQLEAFKFQAETKICTVTDITWNLGRTGKMIPVIQIEPTELSGAVVTNVTGHNASTIRDKEINIGSQIAVRRSGEVIPYLDEVITQITPTIPTNCPYCGSTLEWTDTEIDLICINDDCEGQNYKKMENYINNICRDIKGVGPSFIEGFINYFNAYDIKDLLTKVFNYTGETITTLGNADNEIARQVVATMTGPQTISNFLPALGIRFLGNTFAQEIANSPQNKEFFTALHEDDQEKTKELLLQMLPGRNALAESILNSHKQISRILDVIYKNEQSFSFNSKNATNDAQPRYYAVTGSVSKPRKEFEAELASFNWILTDNINKAELLINNDTESNSSKNLKAKKADKPIVSEAEFREKYISE